MNPIQLFPPQRLPGAILHLAIIAALLSAGMWGLLQASRAQGGPSFLLYLALAFVALASVPWLAYRLYSLYGAWYALERDGLRLRWGLRTEEIPMDQVLWVYPARELEPTPPLPVLFLPGALLGSRKLADGSQLEYLASNPRRLIIIATPGRLYAISPADEEGFLSSYQRLAEMGSLTPLPARSLYPTFLLSRLWADQRARYLILAGLALNLALSAWVALVVPQLAQVPLRLTAQAQAVEFVPAVQLLLLPVLSGLFFAANALLGLFFYRRTVNQPSAWHTEHVLSYLLWSSGALTPALFLGAVYFILQAS